jgi:hypothetical protein
MFLIAVWNALSPLLLFCRLPVSTNSSALYSSQDLTTDASLRILLGDQSTVSERFSHLK